MLIDMISMIGLLLSSSSLSHLFAYAFSVTVVLAIYSLGTKFFNTRTALLAALIFYSFPMVIEFVSTAYIDIQLSLFVFLSLYGLIMFIQSKKNSWLFLSAIFIGLSISSKVFGVLAFASIMVILIYSLFSRLMKKEISFRSVVYKILVFGLIAFAISTPWLVKSYFFTGNPVWPMFNNFFGGSYWDAEHQEFEKNRLLGRDLTITNYLTLPWDLHVQIVEWEGQGVDDVIEIRKRNVFEGEHFGPFLIFLPLYFFLRKKNKILNSFFIFILIYATLLFFLSNASRYLLYIGPLIAIISAYVVIELFKKKQLSKFLKVLLIFTFGFNLLIWAGGNTKDLVVALGFESEDSFYEKQVPIHKPSEFINSNLPDTSKILLVGDVKGFFLERDYVLGNPSIQVYINYSKFNDEDDYYEDIKKKGITHILINNGSFSKYRGFAIKELTYLEEQSLYMTNNLLEKYTTIIYNENFWLVYELI